MRRILAGLVVVMGCAKGGATDAVDGGPGDDAPGSDASCSPTCDGDADGVYDQDDECAGTPAGDPVNMLGCSDAQVDPVLVPKFPPFDLVWTPTGDLGRAGGLVWTYTGIDRADLFHIYWVICDDPATPCGVSLDGAIDAGNENWMYHAAGSNLTGGMVQYINSTNILLHDGTLRALAGRLTVTIVDGAGAPLPFATVSSMGVTPRSGTIGVELPGTAYEVRALVEVQDATLAWMPYLDYYDAAPTPTTGGSTAVSFGASFYAE